MTVTKGFTLLELMIAILIFTLISTASYKLFDSVSRAKEVTDDLLEGLDELQRAQIIIEKDFLQITARSITNELGDKEVAVLAPAKNTVFIEFTRTGWRNPLGLIRSDLQRVAYAVENTDLIRYYWPVLDRGPDARLMRQTLLKNVRSAKVRFMDENKKWRSSWPPTKNQQDAVTGQQAATAGKEMKDDQAASVEQEHVMPQGLIVTIQHEFHGLLEFSFPLATVNSAKNKTGSRREGQDSEGRAKENQRKRDSWGRQ